MFVCMHVSIHVCMYVCMYVCTCGLWWLHASTNLMFLFIMCLHVHLLASIHVYVIQVQFYALLCACTYIFGIAFICVEGPFLIFIKPGGNSQIEFLLQARKAMTRKRRNSDKMKRSNTRKRRNIDKMKRSNTMLSRMPN